MLQAIEMKRNLLLDMIRMIRFRAETKMALPLGGGREGRRPRKILRDLFKSEAELIPEPESGALRVRVPGGEPLKTPNLRKSRSSITLSY